MAFENPDVKVKLQDKEYALRYDLMAAAMAEKEFGGPILPPLQRMAAEVNTPPHTVTLELAPILIMAWAMLQRKHKIRLDKVAELIGPRPQAAVDMLFKIFEAYQAAMPKESEGETVAGGADLPAG